MRARWVAQVMEEGERLSKKQLAQENTIKKLRAELAEARSDKGSTSASLAAERQKACCVRLATCCMQRTQDFQLSLLGLCLGSAARYTSSMGPWNACNIASDCCPLDYYRIV